MMNLALTYLKLDLKGIILFFDLFLIDLYRLSSLLILLNFLLSFMIAGFQFYEASLRVVILLLKFRLLFL
jgi:hypothetical protein